MLLLVHVHVFYLRKKQEHSSSMSPPQQCHEALVCWWHWMACNLNQLPCLCSLIYMLYICVYCISTTMSSTRLTYAVPPHLIIVVLKAFVQNWYSVISWGWDPNWISPSELLESFNGNYTDLILKGILFIWFPNNEQIKFKISCIWQLKKSEGEIYI